VESFSNFVRAQPLRTIRDPLEQPRTPPLPCCLLQKADQKTFIIFAAAVAVVAVAVVAVAAAAAAAAAAAV